MSARIAAVALLAALGAAGCDKNCQNTCYHIYDPGECGINIGGVSEKDLKDQCISECTEALKRTGPMGTYDPYVPHDTENVELQNEKQAAEWMDCVWSATCEELEPTSGGICDPIP
ncbi:MAG: hypothetical protein KC621_18225 [Myxococcales bacterium]|nr:hypothetical protein [Myxococcales bacterium]